MATAAIGIICKAPNAGESKTRLIPRLGSERAAALARAFLIDLARTIEEAAATVGCTGYAVCSPDSAAAELAAFLPSSFDYLVKTDPVLGRVLDGAAGELLARGHESVILVNGDSPTLPAALLVETIRALRQPGDRVVFVPALDGGYSIVGLKRRTSEIFTDIPWSTPDVLRRSLEQAERHAIPDPNAIALVRYRRRREPRLADRRASGQAAGGPGPQRRGGAGDPPGARS